MSPLADIPDHVLNNPDPDALKDWMASLHLDLNFRLQLLRDWEAFHDVRLNYDTMTHVLEDRP